MNDNSRFACNDGTVRVMCNKETNTDWSSQVAVSTLDQSHSEPADAAGSSQSRSDNSHSSSIRRWQTFSPPGMTDDSYVCRVCDCQ